MKKSALFSCAPILFEVDCLRKNHGFTYLKKIYSLIIFNQ